MKKKLNFRLIKVLIFPIVSACLLGLHQAQADIVPSQGKETGDYTLNSFFVLGVNVAQWILGIVGSLTLLMFVYGGFMFLVSGGSSERVASGRKIIVAATVGLIIVFGSWLIIKYVLYMAGINFQGGFTPVTVDRSYRTTN